MSKLFFDHLLDFKQLEKSVKKIAKTQEEREETWLLIDEIVHHKVLGSIIDKLPVEHHQEFLMMFHQSPHDTKLLFDYLKTKLNKNIEEILKQELGELAFKLLKEVQTR